MGVGVGVFNMPIFVWVSPVYGVRYKNVFFTCMATKLRIVYIFTLLAIFSSSAILWDCIQ